MSLFKSTLQSACVVIAICGSSIARAEHYDVQVQLWAGLSANQMPVGDFVVPNVGERNLEDFYYQCRDALFREGRGYGMRYQRNYPVRTVTVRLLDPRTGQPVRDRYSGQARAKAVAFGSLPHRVLVNETEICTFASILAQEEPIGLRRSRWRDARFVIAGSFTQTSGRDWRYDGWNRRQYDGWDTEYQSRFGRPWFKESERSSFYFEYDDLSDLRHQCESRFDYEQVSWDYEMVITQDLSRFKTLTVRPGQYKCEAIEEAYFRN